MTAQATPEDRTQEASLWPGSYDAPSDLGLIEQTPLADRNLPATTYDLLARAAARWPYRAAVSVMPDAKRWQTPVRRTYRDLLTTVHRYANALHLLGIRRNDAVAIMSPNCDQLIPATLAAELAGIAVPINGALSTEHLRHLLDLSGARVLLTAGPDLDRASWGRVRELAATDALDVLLVLDPTGAASAVVPTLDGVRVLSLATIAGQCSGDFFAGDLPMPTHVASLFHTGGTTGAPKLAAHTHRNEVVDAWSIAANSAMDENATLLAALPLFHVNALVVTLLSPMFRGQHAVWAGPLGYRDIDLYGCFWKVVEHYRITTMSAVPTVYAVLAGIPVDANIESLNFALVGASMLPPGVRLAFEEHTGVTLVEGYGLTEGTCASARSFASHPRPGSVGQRLPYQQIKSVRIDDDGTWVDLGPGEVGTVAISGPTVFPGYVVGRDHDGRLVLDGLGKLHDGWLDTGDLGLLDADGFLHLTGRAKDLIIRGGHNLDPALIEDALLSHPDVTGACAVGMPDVHAGEVPVAYVTLGVPVPEQELVAWAEANVAEAAATPKAVHVIDALPVTAVGKPYKLPLRADAARRAVIAALAGNAGTAGLPVGVVDVLGEVEDGHVVVTIRTDASTLEEAAVAKTLDAFALTWRLVAR